MDTPDLPDDAAADHPQPAYPPPPATAREGRGYTIAAFVLAALALLFAPIFLGPAGVALGVVGLRKGDPLGKTAVIAAIVAMVVGIALAVIVGNPNDDALGPILR